MRSDGIPLLVQNGSAIELKPVKLVEKGQGAFDERWLQMLVYEHPHCLPLREIEPGLGELTSICMEVPTKHGYIDNLAMTPDGDLVMVETKLWRNPEARRKVVAQALDYASCLFEMDFQELEKAVLQGDFGGRPKPKTILDLFPERERPAPERFVDAVNTNLRRGRLVVLVAGDGIRTETERLGASLQLHAGVRFTFALVELAVFEQPHGSGYFVHPRTLAKTCMIERAVVRVIDGHAAITQVPALEIPSEPRPADITEESFFEAMGQLDPALPAKLKELLGRVDTEGIYPEYRRSLNLKWDTPAGKPVTFAYIQRNGAFWTDTVHVAAPLDLAQAYLEQLASALDGTVNQNQGGGWQVRVGDKAPRIQAMGARLEQVGLAMERFAAALRAHFAGQS